MAKFGFSDFITLAKSGWTPDEFNKALDRLESMQEDTSEDVKRADFSEDDSSDKNTDVETSEDTKWADSSDNEKDARIKELENQLAEAQKINQTKNNDTGDKKSLDDMVDDIFREYFD